MKERQRKHTIVANEEQKARSGAVHTKVFLCLVVYLRPLVPNFPPRFSRQRKGPAQDEAQRIRRLPRPPHHVPRHEPPGHELPREHERLGVGPLPRRPHVLRYEGPQRVRPPAQARGGFLEEEGQGHHGQQQRRGLVSYRGRWGRWRCC